MKLAQQTLQYLYSTHLSTPAANPRGERRLVLLANHSYPTYPMHISCVPYGFHILRILHLRRPPANYANKKRSDGFRRQEEAPSSVLPCGKCGSQVSEEEGILCEGPCRGCYHITCLPMSAEEVPEVKEDGVLRP